VNLLTKQAAVEKLSRGSSRLSERSVQTEGVTGCPQLSKSMSHCDRQSVGESVLVSGTHLGPATNFFHSRFDYFFRQFRVYWCGAPSLTRRRVCSFQFLPGISSSAFLRSESHGTHEHSLLSLFFRLLQPGGPGSCIYFSQEQGSPVIRRW
jgi:hypothetical protein